MADEPTPGELSRRLDSIASDVRDLVGRKEYSSDQRGLEHRFTDLGRDLEDIRQQHNRDLEALGKRITSEARDAAAKRQGWRTVVYTGLIPALVALLAILAQIWMRGGGH